MSKMLRLQYGEKEMEIDPVDLEQVLTLAGNAAYDGRNKILAVPIKELLGIHLEGDDRDGAWQDEATGKVYDLTPLHRKMTDLAWYDANLDLIHKIERLIDWRKEVKP